MRKSSIQALRPMRSLQYLRATRAPRFCDVSTGSRQISRASISTTSHRQTSASSSRPARTGSQAAIDDTPTLSSTFNSTPSSSASSNGPLPEISSLQESLSGRALYFDPGSEKAIDWSSSFHGLATEPFSPETNAILLKAVDKNDIEIKPDGILFLPEIKYRRILNQAFGPGGWGLAPRGDLVVDDKVVTREYALVAHGRFISQARGECAYFSPETIPTAGEGCKSNALMRACKDLGIASELWDPRFIREYKSQNCQEVWVEHVVNKGKRKIWLRKGDPPAYPFQLATATSGAGAAKTVGTASGTKTYTPTAKAAGR